jgi:hypothetical protein
MTPKRLSSILSGLKRFELTEREKQFLELVKAYFGERGGLTEEQEAILEGIHREKTNWERLGLISRQRAARNSTLSEVPHSEGGASSRLDR